ncbi:MAG: ABC transporter permease [Clostridia bacterium]|nr:ABC transporter permease [Clostridia bacterium]
MSELFADIRTNLKIAFKSVRFNYKQYASFFAALFLIQCFFGMLTISSDMNTRITEEIVYEEYDYDVVFLDLNYYQTVFLQNDELQVFASDHIYDIVRIVDRYHAADDTTTYDVYLDLLGDMQLSFKLFKNKYMPYLQQNLKSGQVLKYNYSEVYKLDSYRINGMVSYVAIAAVMTLVSILLITSLYRIRVNHYKFTYGIYMSFGADYKQLCKTSFWEMMVVSLVTFIPSQAFSVGIIYLIYMVDGFAFTYSPLVLLKVFIINIVIVSVSVCFPMWRVSRNLVTKLLTSEDNSNLVSSPRRSFNFFNLTFPKKYEVVSMWRFRKYLATMIVTAVGFSSIFVAGFYAADVYEYTRSYTRPQYTVTLATNKIYDETLVPDLAVIEGIELVEVTATGEAAYNLSHAKIEKGAVLPTANLVVPEDDDDFRVTNEINYVMVDNKETIDALTSERFDYKIKGDPYEILTDESAVIVSNYIGNKKACDYEVGDIIKVAAFQSQKKQLDQNLQGKNRLREELKFYNFEYIELHVCAVIDGMSTLDGSPMYVAKSVWRELMRDDDAEIDTIDIYIAEDATMDDAKIIFDRIRDYTSLYNGRLVLTDNHVVSQEIITRSMKYYALIIALSFLVLAISPLIWFFSQTLFVKKREKEFSVLLWLGAIKTEIKKICQENGLILAVTATITCLGLSWALIAIIQWCVTQIPPVLYGGTESFYVGIHIPIPALIASVLISMGCGYFSSMLPLGDFLKRFSATENAREYTGSDE